MTETLSDMFDNLEVLPHDAPSAPPSSFKAEGAFETARDARTFMMAGNATVTLVSVKSGTRFTYKVSKPENGDGSFLFVSLLTGPDNWSNYQYFGYIRRGIFFHGGAKAKIGSEAPGAKAFAWAFSNLAKDNLPETLEVWHEGKCGRCGRKLTVPASIASGFGPECINKVGF